MKRITILFAMLFTFTVVQNVFAEKGGNDNGNGGGHTETAGNNLSFPAILLDGYTVTDVTEDLFTVVYDGAYEGLTAEQIAYLQDNGPWYPQKTEGNIWQAGYYPDTSIEIHWIDWGDAIEAVDPKIGRPYRLELVLYVELGVPMQAFTMAELEFPSSKNELQGTNTNEYYCYVASVASPNGHIVVQAIDGNADPSALDWNGTEWIGAGAGEVVPVGFGVENNVGGKLIFGASTGGWKPTATGNYRITFYVAGGNVDLSYAAIGNYNGDGESFTEVIEAENNTPIVDVEHNLTYVDVTVTNAGGGGKKK